MASIRSRKSHKGEEGFIALPIQCNQITGSVSWKNRLFTIPVCAKTAAKAAQNVSKAKISEVVVAEAQRTIGPLGCATGSGCGDAQICVEGALTFTDPQIDQPAAAANCRNTGKIGPCNNGETVWECDVRVSVDAAKQCGCEKPA